MSDYPENGLRFFSSEKDGDKVKQTLVDDERFIASSVMVAINKKNKFAGYGFVKTNDKETAGKLRNTEEDISGIHFRFD